ncbi:Gfo/Idh/MocA family protein [Litorivivens sp.]|uniref:Gfo/Idh/MocA family protein n=1 Tax=Litorivivens sp. TaxID=2020868 RepID=UPI0035632314
MTVRLGVIGLGNIARQHIQNVVSGAVPGCTVSAICSRTVPDELPEGAQHFSDYRDLIGSGACDAVLVASPTFYHREMGLAVLQSGLHLMMEKPIALSNHEAQEMLAAAQPDQVFGLMLNQRCSPVFKAIKAVIDAGELGEIKRTHWTMTNWFRPDVYFAVSDWRATWKGEGGGLLVNQCIHNLDIFQWLCGIPESVYGFCSMGKYHPIEVEDEVTAYFTYANGASGTFIGSTGEAPGFNRLDIVGDRASLTFDGQRIVLHDNQTSVAEYCRSTRDMFGVPQVRSRDITPEDANNNQHAEILNNFVAAIERGETLIAPAADGLNSLGIANAILLSHWQGQAVACPPDAAIYQAALDERIQQSQLRERQDIEVTIDMDKSYR